MSQSNCLRVGYADPPYPGQSRKHYKDHADYAGEVDHAHLIEELGRDFDAWVLHTNTPSLRTVLADCPEVRIGAWVKSFAIFKPHVPVAYAWEPVIFFGGRARPADAPTITDYVIAPVELKKGVAGAKPAIVCRWAFDMLGLEPSDHLTDLFPGSGAVGAAWQAWQAAPPLRLVSWSGPQRRAQAQAERLAI